MKDKWNSLNYHVDTFVSDNLWVLTWAIGTA